MGIVEKVPGFSRGATVQNIVVAVGYFILAGVVLILSPLLAAVALGTNYRGAADRLSALPGVGEGGGATSGAVGALYGFAILSIVLVGATASDGPSGADGDQAQAPTPTAEPTPTPQPPREATIAAAREGAEGQYVAQVDSVELGSDFRGRDGMMVDVRVRLESDPITGADRAEHMGGTVARRTIQAVVTSDTVPENVTAVAVFASVPTSDGDHTVSTKVVVDATRYEDTDWSAYPWQRLRDDADQYRFNDYLYN